MKTLGFSTTINPKPLEVPDSASLDYKFDWAGKLESESYEPLKEFLLSKSIHTQIIGNGTGLDKGLLYEVDIFSLKPRSVSSEVLRATNEEPKHIFKLSGRTDLVTLANPNIPIINGNVKYFIEIKTVDGFKEKISIREAILQLIGGNVGALYHSPPVFLTNLNKYHYVFYISQVPDESIFYHKLNVYKMATFGEAIKFLEDHTRVLRSVTRDFARMPTPRPSIKSVYENVESSNVELIDTSENDDDLDLLI